MQLVRSYYEIDIEIYKFKNECHDYVSINIFKKNWNKNHQMWTK